MSPTASGPAEYMIGTYRPGDYEYVGVPLDHSQAEEESSGPSTAEIIANQSQDYVDEKLAEYQATIQQLQSEYPFTELPILRVSPMLQLRQTFNCKWQNGLTIRTFIESSARRVYRA